MTAAEHDWSRFASLSGSVLPLAVYALAVPMPGPSFLMITRVTLGFGRLAGAAAALGTTLGAAFYATATVLGVTTLAAALPWLVTAMQFAGGACLVFLGVSALRAAAAKRNRPEAGIAVVAAERRPLARILGKALLVGLSNPKMAAFFFGLFAPVVGDPYATHSRLIALCGVLLIDLVYHQSLAGVVSLLAASKPAKRARSWLDALAGTLMTAFGMRLFAEALRSR